MDLIKKEINHLGFDLLNSNNDGFSQWAAKKKLYEMLFEIEDILAISSSFGSLEQEFLDSHAKEKTWRILSK